MAFSHGPIWWSNFSRLDFLNNHIYEAFGLVTRCKPNVNQEKWSCTKYWMCWFFLKVCPKRAFLEKNIKIKWSLTIFFSSLRLHLSLLLVKFVEDVARKSSRNILYKKKMSNLNLNMFNVIYMWHVPCVVYWALFATRFTICAWILEF